MSVGQLSQRHLVRYFLFDYDRILRVWLLIVNLPCSEMQTLIIHKITNFYFVYEFLVCKFNSKYISFDLL